MTAQQQEFVFHDTIPLGEDKLPKARERAQSQKDIILSLFKAYPDRWFSPYDIMDLYTQETGKPILITSARRSITDLTKEFNLIKGGRGEQVEEVNGSPNNRWKYNSEAMTEGVMPFMERTRDDNPEITDVEIEDWNRILNESI